MRNFNRSSRLFRQWICNEYLYFRFLERLCGSQAAAPTSKSFGGTPVTSIIPDMAQAVAGFSFAWFRDSCWPRAGLNLFFGTSGEINCDSRKADAPSPSKAHVQRQRCRVTSGAQDFENVEQFGHRYLNRADSEKSPRLNPLDKHSSVTQRACQSIRNYWRRVRSWCCDCAKNKSLTMGRQRCCFVFRFLPVRHW